MDRIHNILNSINQNLSIKTVNRAEYDDDDHESPEEKLKEQPQDIDRYKKSYYDMSVGSLRAIMNHAKNILDHLDDPSVKENLTAPHLQGIIAVVEDHMRGIHDFVMYVSESDDKSDADSKPGLWENIRKKKEREGKKYRPAKPGDKDRPDPEQWKKLTKNK
jgi:hypothetical protein